MSVKYSKCPLNISIFSHLRPYKFVPIWIFGLKRNHLATLLMSELCGVCMRMKLKMELNIRIEGGFGAGLPDGLL
jgi:hypothetical protein